MRAIETVAESGRGAGARRPLHSQRDAGATKESSSNVSLGGNSGRSRPSQHKLAEGAGGVVEHGEGQQEDQEENCRGYDELQEFLTGTS